MLITLGSSSMIKIIIILLALWHILQATIEILAD